MNNRRVMSVEMAKITVQGYITLEVLAIFCASLSASKSRGQHQTEARRPLCVTPFN